MQDKEFINSLGMKLVRVESGSFVMGEDCSGDFDERPAHRVNITGPLYVATTPVTNAQYEEFDPSHKALRGKRGISIDDSEAVVSVSWDDAARFCKWLSKKEGKPYRLPSEAEWEYVCRAGTFGQYHTGDQLHDAFLRNQREEWDPLPVSLHVGKTPANAFGLHDMHGLVEEWCWDWYGPYEASEQTDPVGRAEGLFRVTRGGSHNTTLPYLRSANRAGTLPEDKHWFIGFRVVMGKTPKTKPLPPEPKKLWATAVTQRKASWPTAEKAFFEGPIRYVHPPAVPSQVPFYPHNHCPSITWCPNGDLLAAWFSTRREQGREMTILATRLRRGAREWDASAEFFKAPDRNMTGTSLFNDGKGRLIFINGLEAAQNWRNLALVMRTSTDNGATWSKPELINAEHQPRNQVISGMSMTREGWLIQPCDASWAAQGGSAIHISRDGGKTWTDPGAGTPAPAYRSGAPGGTIAGIHAGVVQLTDGRLMAFGRGDNLLNAEGRWRMPMSLSEDMGKSWTYHPSEFGPVWNGQRLVLMRLREGPIFFAAFTDSAENSRHPAWPWAEGISVTDRAGRARRVFGLYAALSFDEGKTWPVKKLVTPGKGAQKLNGGAWTGAFSLDAIHAEPRGYMAVTQSPDGVVHLISSALHYRFNLAWLKEPMEA